MPGWRIAGTALLVAAVANVAAAYEPTLDTETIRQALAIGQSRLAVERTRFHAPYHVAVSAAPVDYIEVATPFRRVVLMAEGRAAGGERNIGQRQALELLAASANRLDVLVELTFHPQNTFIGVPEYRVVMRTADTVETVLPTSIERQPRYGYRVEGLPSPVPTPGGALPNRGGRTEPMLGGELIAHFDERMLDVNGRYDIVVIDGDKEMARGRFDLRQLR